MALVDAFKEELKDRNLLTEIRAQKTGCLDTCGMGPSVVVYPEGVWYGNVQLSDIKEIVESHLINDQPVDRLQLKFAPKV
jgi:(2Fe-2S) ferredoxin